MDKENVTKEELLELIKDRDKPLEYDGIYDKGSAIKHFRETSKKYKEQVKTLEEENSKLTTQKIAFTQSYKKVLEENDKLKKQLFNFDESHRRNIERIDELEEDNDYLRDELLMRIEED